MEEVKQNDTQAIKTRLEKMFSKYRNLKDLGESAIILGGVSGIFSMFATNFDIAGAALAVCAAGGIVAAKAIKNKYKYQDILAKIKKESNPDKYYQELLTAQRQKTEKTLVTAKGKDRNLNGEEVSDARMEIRYQRSKLNILEQAHSLAKPCGKEQTVRRLTDIIAKSDRKSGGTELVLSGIFTVGAAAMLSSSAVPAAAMAGAYMVGAAIYRKIKQMRKDRQGDNALGVMNKLVNHHKNQEK